MAGPITPYLQVDLARVRRNVRAASERATMTRVALRPHVKTHKSAEIARLQMASGAVGLTVATVGEAEAFARAGFRDLFIAYPLWLDEPTSRRLADLAELVTLAIGVDSVEGAANAGRMLGGGSVEVMVEVDSGQHRTGADPCDAGHLAVRAERAGARVRGVFTFPGHSYTPGGLRDAADDEAGALTLAVAAMAHAGIVPSVVSGGSTPSLAFSHTEVVTELRPGVYVFGDAQQWELGTVDPDDLALTCRATVVSHAHGRVVLNAGSKILGADRAPYATGFGRLIAHPAARIVQLSEHHAVVDLAGAPLPRLGSELDVLPNHVCAAVNLVDELWVDDDGRLRSWPVTARGLNG